MKTWNARVWGWSWLGVGRLTLRFDESSQHTYTLWTLFVTTKLALSVHVGGRKRSVQPAETIKGGAS